ncbi:MAG: tetratricopeptide repeat protein [Bacteroidales bacterium]|nr:tetratricopeptide repeat protein [Bacteroidales bacterium]
MSKNIKLLSILFIWFLVGGAYAQKADSLNVLIRSKEFSNFNYKQRVITLNELIDLNWQFAPEQNIKLANYLVSLSKENNDKQNEALSYKIIGKAYYQGSYFQQALLNFQKCLKTSESINFTEGVSAANYNIGLIFIARQEYDKALVYTKKALSIDKVANNNRGQASCYNSLGVIYKYLGNTDKAVIYFNKARNQAIECNCLIEKSNAHLNIGIIYKHNNNYSLAYNQYELALKAAENCNYPQGIANVNLEIGKLFVLQGYDSKALQYILNSLEKNRKLGNKKSIAQSLNSIGNIYRNQKSYNKALENYNEALLLEKTIKNKKGQIILLNNIGTTYLLKKNFIKALSYFNQSIEISSESNNEETLATTFENIGILYVKQQNFNLALKNYIIAFEKRKRIKNKDGVANVAYNIALLHLKMGDMPKAIEYLDISRNIAEEYELHNLLLSCYSGYTDVYSANGEFQKSLYYYKLYSDVKDSIFTREGDIRIAELQTQYETEKKQRKIEQQESELNITHTELEKKRIQLLYAILAVLLAVVFTVYLINTQRKLKSQSKRLNLKNKKLNKLSEFKEDLTNMIVHDLKTPLSTIINVKLLKNENNFIEIIEQTGYNMLNLIENILDVYKFENTTIPLRKSSVQLSGLIQKSISEIKFHAESKGLKFKIDIDTKIHCNIDGNVIKRILTNLLSNAVKFSPQNSKIKISASIINSNTLKLGILNQGSGIPKEFQKIIFDKFKQAEVKEFGGINSSGLGLTYCRMAIKAHNEQIGVISESESGVEFWLTLPFTKNEIEISGLDDNITLNNAWSEELMPYLIELSNYKTYEISEINKVIQKINKLDNSDYVKIAKDINAVLYTGDEKIYIGVIQDYINKITIS